METEIQRYQGTTNTSEIEKAFLDHHELVYKAAFRITGNASDAEDVLQTLFLRLVRREWLPNPDSGWPAYLHRAAINIALDITRTRGRQVQMDDTQLLVQENRPDPYREHSATELRHYFTAALSELNATAAEMFVLRYVEGFSIREIANLLQTSKGTIAVTLFRTRSRLQKSMKKFLGGSK